jgi:hypothetical protein
VVIGDRGGVLRLSIWFRSLNLFGAFGDYDWSCLKGHLNPPAAIGLVATRK